MIGILQDIVPQVHEELCRCGKRVRNMQPGCWSLRLSGCVSLKVIATIQQEWLCLEAALPRQRRPASAGQLARWLQQNSSLRGGVRFALQKDLQRGVLLAEISLEEDHGEHLQQRLFSVCEGLVQAVATAPKPASENACREPVPPLVLADLCREAGWAFNERSESRVAVPLQVLEGFDQALLEVKANGAVRAWVDFCSVADGAELAHCATGVLLLRAARWLRLARPTAASTDGVTVFGWEGVIDEPVTAGALSSMLMALSVACQVSAREIRAVQEDSIARSFLELQGGTWLFSSEIHEPTRKE